MARAATDNRRAGLYCRLSKDDEGTGESASIQTQKAMLAQYAAEHGLAVIDTYADDGYSGLDFERPGFQRMVADIEEGRIDCVVTKDLSRLGRDHLKVGFYTEIFFPSKKVRYIAVNDGVDSASGGGGEDFSALKSVINEFYSRDVSRKVRTSIRARAKQGLYRCSFAPLGYKKDEADHNHLVPDDETAWIVRRVFELAAAGWGRMRILKELEREQVPCPAWFMHQRGAKDYGDKFADPQERCHWHPATVTSILKNPVYVGTTVGCKTEKLFKVGLQVKTDEGKRVVVEGTHEALISREVFELANARIAERRRRCKDGEPTIFSGLVKCAECGKQMSKRYYPKSKKYLVYVCGTYAYRGVAECSAHQVFYDDLYRAVLEDIRALAEAALADRAVVVERLRRMKGLAVRKEKAGGASRIAAAEKRLSEVERAFDRLYEDRLSGAVSEGNYSRLSAKYQSEQAELEAELAVLRSTAAETHREADGIERFADLVGRFVGLEELTAEVLNELVERIDVHERQEAEGGGYRQQIDICYRFIGRIGDTDFSVFKPASSAALRWAKVQEGQDAQN